MVLAWLMEGLGHEKAKAKTAYTKDTPLLFGNSS
jgi:hypothetical protein